MTSFPMTSGRPLPTTLRVSPATGRETGKDNKLSMGVIGPTQSASLIASKDDNEACSGMADNCDSSTWHQDRRIFTLSNDEVIWDMSGNVREWVKDDNVASRSTPLLCIWEVI